jgi:PAS domain S-box-containing protein
VTAQAETERVLLESEERLRSIVGTAADGIVVIDERGLIQSINPAEGRMFGYAAHEVIGQNVSMLMPEPERSAHQSYIDAYCQTGAGKIIGTSRDLEHQCKDGSLFASNLTVAEWHAGGKRYFTGIVRNVSECKRQEEQIKLLIRELNHRCKNMLTLVQAVARQTFAAKPDDLISCFEERMQGLAAKPRASLLDLAGRASWSCNAARAVRQRRLYRPRGFPGGLGPGHGWPAFRHEKSKRRHGESRFGAPVRLAFMAQLPKRDRSRQPCPGAGHGSSAWDFGEGCGT